MRQNSTQLDSTIKYAMNLPTHTSTTSTTSTPTTVVDLNVFCDTAQTLAAQTPASAFELLNDYVEGSLQAVNWQVTGSSKAVQGAQYDSSIEAYARYLHVKASSSASVMCGRCLQAMSLELLVDTQLQVFQTDEAADEAALADNADTLPDPIVAHRQFDLVLQVQEELLLNIPENPVHDEDDVATQTICKLPSDAGSKKLSPFAGLAGLMS
jgi:uncharacterized metal-binding protein YceD (DUF177 family)